MSAGTSPAGSPGSTAGGTASACGCSRCWPRSSRPAPARCSNNQYDWVSDINRPDVALSNDTLTMGGISAAAALVLLTLVAAILGGKSGKRYHDKIDRLLD